MEYMSPKKAGELWGISSRRVIILCVEGRIKGAQKFSGVWLIPNDTVKPVDARIKSGKYIKKKPEETEENNKEEGNRL